METSQWLRKMNNFIEDLANSRLTELQTLCDKYAQTSANKNLIAKAKKYSDSEDLKGFYRSWKRLFDHDLHSLACIYIAAKGFYDVLRLEAKIKANEIYAIGVSSNDLLMAEMVNALDWYARAQSYDAVDHKPEFGRRMRDYFINRLDDLKSELATNEKERDKQRENAKRNGEEGGRLKFEKLKKEAIRLAQSYPEIDSKRVAKKIYKEVREYALAHKLKPLSLNEDHKTIARWIERARKSIASE